MQLSPVTETFGAEDQSWLGSSHGTNSARSVTLDVTKFTKSTHYPNGYLLSGTPLAKVVATGLYGPYSADVSEVQVLTITGTPTGGTFTVTFNGVTSAAIAYNATAATVQAALVAMDSIGAGNVAVTGSAGGPWTLTFQGALAGSNVNQVTATASFTGGSSPAITPTTTTGGGTDSVTTGLQTLVGFLFTSIEVIARDGSTPGTVIGALLDHGRIIESKLPIDVDADGKSNVAGQIWFV